MSKSFKCSIAIVLLTAGIGWIILLHLNHKSDQEDAANRALNPATMKQLVQHWRETNKYLKALYAFIPHNTAFTNAVAILGTNYLMETHKSYFIATFPPCWIPGLTNRYILSLNVRSNLCSGGIGSQRLDN